MRDEQLRDEVQRAVSSMQPHDRERFLKDLTEQFPVWNDGVTVAAPAPVMQAKVVEIKDPKVLADRLFEAARGLNPVERAEIAAKLAGAGLIQEKQVLVGGGGGGAADVPASAAGEMKKVLGLPPDATLDAARVAEITSMLSEFVIKLEPWAVQFWREVAPDAKNAYYQVLNKELGKYMARDESVSKEQVSDAVYDLRSLVSLMLKGIAEAGKQFSRDHMQRYSVDVITRDSPAGSFVTSKDVQCWKHYQKLMEGVDGAAIEKRLKALLAKDVDTGLDQVRKRRK